MTVRVVCNTSLLWVVGMTVWVVCNTSLLWVVGMTVWVVCNTSLLWVVGMTVWVVCNTSLLWVVGMTVWVVCNTSLLWVVGMTVWVVCNTSLPWVSSQTVSGNLPTNITVGFTSSRGMLSDNLYNAFCCCAWQCVNPLLIYIHDADCLIVIIHTAAFLQVYEMCRHQTCLDKLRMLSVYYFN